MPRESIQVPAGSRLLGLILRTQPRSVWLRLRWHQPLKPGAS